MDKTRNGVKESSNMAVNDLTLDEMFALEREHSPFVGGRTGEFLKPSERANAKPRPGKLYNGVLTKNPAPAGIPQRKVVHKPHLRSIVLSKSQIVASIAEKTEIS